MNFLVTLKGDYGKCVHAQQGLNIINIICKSQVIFCLIQHKSPKETLRLHIDCEYPKGISFFSYYYHQQKKNSTQKGYRRTIYQISNRVSIQYCISNIS